MDQKRDFSSVAEALAKATSVAEALAKVTAVAEALAKVTAVTVALAKATIGFGFVGFFLGFGYFGFSENLVPKKEKLIDIGF